MIVPVFYGFPLRQKSRQISEEQKKNYCYNEAPEREATNERTGWMGGSRTLNGMAGRAISSTTEMEKSKLNLETSSDLEKIWMNLRVCKYGPGHQTRVLMQELFVIFS